MRTQVILILSFLYFIVEASSCKPKGIIGDNTPSTKQQTQAVLDPNQPQILMCDLKFYKGEIAPKVNLQGLRILPGTLNDFSSNYGDMQFKFFDENHNVITIGKFRNPLFFNAEDKDPETGKLTAHPSYRDSAFKLIRVPYKKEIHSLEIIFTDSLKKQHLLISTPIQIKKS